MRRVLLLVIILIVYGSLYPWHFAAPHLPGGPFSLLLSWDARFDRFLVRDTVVNLALYIPFGMAAHLVFRRWRLPLAGYWLPVLLGALLSASIETVQVFVPTRTSSLNDLVYNVVGSALGVLLGILFEKAATARLFESVRFHPADRGALLLAFLWIAYLIFPVFPLAGLYIPARKLHLFFDSPAFAPVLFFSGLVAWYVVGKQIRAAGWPRASLWLSLMLVVFPLQLFLVGRQPVRSAFLGAIAGIVLFLLAESLSSKPAVQLEAWAFLALLVYRGLSPFHFGPRQDFAWVPFSGLLNTDWQSGVMILIEKAWYYGTAVWLLRVSGVTLAQAAALVAVVLGVIEGVQTHLPGRTAEITDPLLALIMALVLAATRRTSASPSASPRRAPSDRTAQT